MKTETDLDVQFIGRHGERDRQSVRTAASLLPQTARRREVLTRQRGILTVRAERLRVSDRSRD